MFPGLATMNRHWYQALVLLCVFASSPLINEAVMHAQQNSSSGSRYALVLHGGAGGEPDQWTEDYKTRRRQSLASALDAGIQVLSGGGSALDAVEQVVRALENDPMFNAGRGCVLNEQGEHELDASIMDGSNLACGAVAGVKRAKNPITLARRVMQDTPHVLLSSTGADRFAESCGLELVGPDYFITEDQIKAWKKWKAQQEELKKGAVVVQPRYLGTVGCVAIDGRGNIAAGTSTGGLMGKRWGRVGDSPIIGAGTYASNATCGVSCTGTGEEFIRHHVASDMADRLKYAGQSLTVAAHEIIDKVLPDDCGGLIAIDKNYNIVTHFNTAAMARALADSTGRREIRIARENP